MIWWRAEGEVIHKFGCRPVLAILCHPTAGYSGIGEWWWQFMHARMFTVVNACTMILLIMITRCSMWETRETALLHVACGNPARRRYCIGAKFSCISSWHTYSYIQQSGRNLQTMNAKNTKKSPLYENVDTNITCDFGDGDISRSRSWFPHTRTDKSLARL